MRFVVFGLTASSTWGNGHATLWRGLARSLGAQEHDRAGIAGGPADRRDHAHRSTCGGKGEAG